MSFAGSAIKQGVGNLNKWKSWKPSKKKHGWLLISGGTNDIDSECFLKGTKFDMQVMEEMIKSKKLGYLQNVLRIYDLEKYDALKRIKRFFLWCRERKYKPVIYYTGHGEVGTGNWEFSDGVISIRESRLSIWVTIPLNITFPIS